MCVSVFVFFFYKVSGVHHVPPALQHTQTQCFLSLSLSLSLSHTHTRSHTQHTRKCSCSSSHRNTFLCMRRHARVHTHTHTCSLTLTFSLLIDNYTGKMLQNQLFNKCPMQSPELCCYMATMQQSFLTFLGILDKTAGQNLV